VEQEAQLKRTLTLPVITFYGIGTILGAGIYVLIGKVAGTAGMYAPISFLIAATVATFTAFSYAEMCSRYPKSAGEAIYIKAGFQWEWLATIVGWLIVLTGIVSAATISNGFVGYLHLFIPNAPESLVIVLLTLVMGSIAAWGIKESATIIVVITLLEISGLLLVLAVAGDSLATLPQRWHELRPPSDGHIWAGIGLGGFLAFYAFIGFEDMVNCAEEVINPERTLPIAILLALVVSATLYVLVSLVAVLSLGADSLAASNAPLARIVENAGYSITTIGMISLVAVVNGALVQIIMASRVIYGLGFQHGAPRFLSYVHPKTQTPLVATILVTIMVLGLALWFPLETLAKSTSFIILSVFALVNISLLLVKRREPKHMGSVCYPRIIPFIGFLLCISFLGVQIFVGR